MTEQQLIMGNYKIFIKYFWPNDKSISSVCKVDVLQFSGVLDITCRVKLHHKAARGLREIRTIHIADFLIWKENLNLLAFVSD